VHQQCIKNSLCASLLKSQEKLRQLQVAHHVRSAYAADKAVSAMSVSPSSMSDEDCELTQRRVCNAEQCEGEGWLAVSTLASAVAEDDELHFGSDCVVSSWDEWSLCSQPCGSGVSGRRREIIAEPTHGPIRCPPLEQVRDCEKGRDRGFSSLECLSCGGGEIKAAPKGPGEGAGSPISISTSTDFGVWSACSQTCGGGTQARPTPRVADLMHPKTATVLQANLAGAGTRPACPFFEERVCNEDPCPYFKSGMLVRPPKSSATSRAGGIPKSAALDATSRGMGSTSKSVSSVSSVSGVSRAAKKLSGPWGNVYVIEVLGEDLLLTLFSAMVLFCCALGYARVVPEVRLHRSHGSSAPTNVCPPLPTTGRHVHPHRCPSFQSIILG
jgi:hypothetical protein